MIDGYTVFDWYATLAAGGGASSNTIDLSQIRDLGASRVNLFVTLSKALAGGTLQVEVQTSPDNTTWTTLQTSGTIPVGASGFVFQDNLPLGVLRYLRLFYVGTGITAGQVSAGLNINGPDTQGQRYYPRNYQA